VSGKHFRMASFSQPCIYVYYFFTFRDDKIACYRSTEHTAQTGAAFAAQLHERIHAPDAGTACTRAGAGRKLGEVGRSMACTWPSY